MIPRADPLIMHTTPLVADLNRSPALRRSTPLQLWLAGGLFALAWAAFAVLHAAVGRRSDQVALGEMDGVLATCAAVAAVVYGTLMLGRGRPSRRAWDVSAGALCALFGALVLHTGRLDLEAGWALPAGVWVTGLIATVWSLHRDEDGRLWDASFAIVAAGIAQAAVAGAVAPMPPGATVWTMAPHLFVLVGFTAAFTGLVSERNQRVAGQRRLLADSRLAARTEGARLEALVDLGSDLRHDLRSALFAVDGSAQLLTDRYSELSEQDRTDIATMLTASIERLRDLLDVRSEVVDTFAVGEVARSVAHASRKRQGPRVTVEVPADLKGVGRPADVAATINTLLRSAQVRSGARPVVLRGERRGSEVVLLLEPGDLAPPPPVVFSGPVADLDLDPDADDDLFDLCMASRLMGAQGGDVWAARHAGGAVSFGLRLPAFIPAATTPNEVNA